MTSERESLSIYRVSPLIGGILSLAVAMGIGRFAYTPLLPAMQQQLHWSLAFAGLVASANYGGYLLGALTAGALPLSARWTRLSWAATALLVVSFSVMAMGLTGNAFWWLIWRVLAGVFSAWAQVFVSSLVLDWLATHGQEQRAGMLYAGVGSGIVLTGLLGPWWAQIGGWRIGWIGLGLVGVTLSVAAVLSMRPLVAPAATAKRRALPSSGESLKLWGLITAYGLEGLGYIIMATFITQFFRSAGQMLGDISWILVGLAAIPSTILWARAAQRWGGRTALLAAYGIEAVGVLLPALGANDAIAIVSALLFGGTFMAIAALGLVSARKAAPASSHRVIAAMTAAFGLGQIIGPLGAAALARNPQGLNITLLGSALLLGVAMIILRATWH